MKHALAIMGILGLLNFAACSSAPKSGGGSDNGTGTSEGTKTAAAAKDADSFTCVKGKDSRTVTRLMGVSGGCQVEYTKHGEKRVVASAVKDVGHCETVANRIRKHLEDDTFSCQ